MSDFLPYEASAPIADGRTIIEASAGTGKTYTIAAAVTALVASEGLPLGNILVVTFTRAATAELKSRVRQRMFATLRAMEGHDSTIDPHIALLVDADADTKALAIDRLTDALTHFDNAQIFTIHGFAQRLMSQLGFRARLAADLEPGEIDQALLAQVASDLVVKRFAHNPDNDEVVTPGQLKDIGAAVVGTPDARIVPDAADLVGKAHSRVELAHQMNTEMKHRLRALRQITFDDGLSEARDSLTDPEVGAAARSLLRRRYAVALVDEAQDTDPTQWQIIRAVFDDSRLVVIGDPKQSIYSFRGADIESYLSAVNGADAKLTLETNWRSDGPLITALDTLFNGATFGDDRIQYRDVRPAPGHAAARLDGPPSALSIHRFGPNISLKRKKSGEFYADDAREAVANDVAFEIVELLHSGATIHDDSGLRQVGPADIAVLCRTRRQVDFVRNELRRRDVPTVAARTGSVFLSEAAEAWRRLLLAIEQPERTGLVRLAATTILVGHSPAEVADLDDAAVFKLQQLVMGWGKVLNRDGLPALVADLNRTTQLAARVLTHGDGERLMTDITHLAEQMHALWRRGRTGSLATWLEGAIAESGQLESDNVEEAESRQRRLETDADAVQVQTIHSAKGLEYPVVFVPFGWDTTPPRITIPVFHDPKSAGTHAPRGRLINVAGKGSPGFDAHEALAKEEAKAEEGRLLYVSLTRARHRLDVWWIEDAGPTKQSKLTELITRNGRDPADLDSASGGTIDVVMQGEIAPVIPYDPPTTSPARLVRAEFDRGLDYRWQRASFTSLSPDHPLTGGGETSEQPLRADEGVVDPDDDQNVVPSAGVEMPMADLPRGARFGTLVHHIYEQVPFDTIDLEAAVHTELDLELARSEWDFDADAFTAGIVASMQTPLGPDDDTPRLCDLDPARLLDEMTFELPVRTDRGAVTLRAIGELMLEHLPSDDPYRAFGEHLQGLSDPGFRGYLAGAIDLTTELSGPDGSRFVVIDYKSNTLASQADEASPLDYGPGPLAGAMVSGNYVLQATIYQVALHRYLQWRLPGYDPATHLGGSMYLFVRGMVGADTPVVEGERCGVARWQPPADLIVSISDLFVGSGS